MGKKGEKGVGKKVSGTFFSRIGKEGIGFGERGFKRRTKKPPDTFSPLAYIVYAEGIRTVE
jgi:hypothetical protein